MRILIVTQSFPPEIGALPSRMYPFAEELTRAGHDVCIATAMPNYPKGKIFEEYRGLFSSKQLVDGYTVLRTWSYCVPRNISKVRQLLSYLSFIPAVFWSGLKAGDVDVVFVTSPPIFPAIAAMALASVRRAKLVFDIRDLWPDEFIACGAAREGSLPIKMISALERLIYRRSDLICCTTESFMHSAIERGAAPEKMAFLPNGADVDLFRPALNGDAHRAPELQGKFVVLFSGIIGIKQGLDALVATAKLLESERDIVFHLVGSGSREQEVRRQVRELGLKNLVFAGEKTLHEIPPVIQAADVCISLLMPEPYLQKIVSVKIYEYLACGKPIIGAHEGESARVISDSGAGLLVPPGDAVGLANAIRRLRDNRTLLEYLGAQGRRWVEQHRSRRTIAQQLERLLTGAVQPGEPIQVPEPPVEEVPTEFAAQKDGVPKSDGIAAA